MSSAAGVSEGTSDGMAVTAVADVLGRIPYLASHELLVGERGGVVEVVLPSKVELTNHVGVVHAGAMFTAAETAAGVAAWHVVPDGAAYVLLREARVRYTRRAEGEVRSIAQVDEAAAREARGSFAETRRGDVLVEVEAFDLDGEKVFVGSFDYALREVRRDD